MARPTAARAPTAKGVGMAAAPVGSEVVAPPSVSVGSAPPSSVLVEVMMTPPPPEDDPPDVSADVPPDVPGVSAPEVVVLGMEGVVLSGMVTLLVAVTPPPSLCGSMVVSPYT